MNREIEFRGLMLCTDNIKRWVYGYLENKNTIRRKEISLDIIPETLGQYTGLKDKNGAKIFEGDIIRLDDDYRKSISSADAKTEDELVRKDCLVGFKDGSFMFCRNKYIIDNFDSYLWLTNEHCEVIGNIYEGKQK